MRNVVPQKLLDYTVLAFLAFTILWRGGKGIEATWLLALLAGALTFLWWMHRPAERDDAPAVPDATWIAGLLFLLWSVLSYIFSLTQNYGLDEVLRDSALFLLLLWCARRAAHDQRWSERILRFIAVVALVGGIIGIAVYILQPVNRMVGSFFDYRFHTDYWPNAWAEFLLLAWPTLYFFFRSETSQKRRWIGTIGLGFLLGCLFLSYSRGALIAFFGQVILLTVLQLRHDDRAIPSLVGRLKFWVRQARSPAPRQAYLLPIIAIVLFFSCNALRAQFFDVQSIREKITFQAAEGDSSKTERLQFWRQAVRLANERPLTGFGPYSFRFTQPYLQEGVLETSDHAHNVLLKIASERGWPALVFWLIAAGALIIPTLIRAWRGSLTTAQLASLVAVLGLFAHNLIDYNLQFVGIALTATLLLANLASVKGQTLMNRRLSRTMEILVAMLLLIVAVWEGRFLVTSSLGRRAEARGNVSEALAWYQRSERELFSRDLYLSEAQMAMQAGDPALADHALELYKERNQIDFRFAKLMAQWLLDQGKIDESLVWFSQAFSAGKFNDLSITLSYLAAAEQARIAGKSPDHLLNDLSKEALDDLFNAYRQALMTNAHYIDLSPNADAFQDLSAMLALREPSSANYYLSIANEVATHVQMERSRLASRNPGFLW